MAVVAKAPLNRPILTAARTETCQVRKADHRRPLLATARDPACRVSVHPARWMTLARFNAVTIQYAKELRDTNVLINNACPGYVATDLNAFNGTQTPEQGAAIAIRLATLPDDGPTGGLFDDTGIVPW